MSEQQQERLKALGKALVSKGVPPFLVAANITEPEYDQVHLWKQDGWIFVRTRCVDPDDGQQLTFLYHYDETVTLQKIEMELGGRTSIHYDRKDELQRLADAAGFKHTCDMCKSVEDFIRNHAKPANGEGAQ